MDCRLQVISPKSGELIAAYSNADISETENLFSFFIAFVEFTLNLEFFEKKDQSHSLSITEIIRCETGRYLNDKKPIFHATLRKTTC